MKPIFILLLTFGLMLSLNWGANAQAPTCGGTVPFYHVDLTGDPDGVWYSPSRTREGNCCGSTSPDRCISFEVVLDSNAIAVNFHIVSGAIPPGSLYYQVDCGPIAPVGEHICIVTPGVHYLTFCKPGNNENVYAVTSVSRPMFPGEDTVEIECSKVIEVLGLTEASTIWTSVYPGTPGQYDSLLSCTNCTTPVFSPGQGTPEYIDYVVTGSPIASDCGAGLTFSDTVRIHTWPKLEVTIDPSPAVFCSENSASGVMVTATATGGDGVYTFLWKNSANEIVGTSSSYFAKEADLYTITVSDGQTGPDCPPAMDQVSVQLAPLPVVNAGSDQHLCHEIAAVQLQGSMQNASGGIWTGGSGSFSPSNTALYALYVPTPMEIAAGSVELTLTSNNSGVCKTASDKVMLFFAPRIDVAAQFAPILCFGGHTTINLNVSGGVPPFAYLWNTGAITASLNDIAAGEYSVTITDNISCVARLTIVVGQPELLIASATGAAQVSCHNASDGWVNVTVSGGTGVLSYSLNGGLAQNSGIFNGLAAGSYSVLVTDANGCNVTTNIVIIANPPQLAASAIGAPQVSCHNASDGWISVAASGGTGILGYSINGGVPQANGGFSGLSAGSYSIIVTDTQGCTAATDTVIIANPLPLVASAVGSNQVSCNNGQDGEIVVTASGGTGALIFVLNGGIPQSSNVFGGLGSGSYTVVVTDSKGCSVTTKPVVIAGPTLLSATATGSSQVSCYNAHDGIMIVTAIGGSGTLHYSMNGGISQLSNIFDGLSWGSYSVVVTDSMGCLATTNTVVINNPPQLMAMAEGSSQVSCFNATDGHLFVTASGGTGVYQYSLNNGPLQSSDIFNGLAAGSYTVMVYDANNCTALTNTVVIINPDMPVATAEGSSQVSCFNATDGVVTVMASGGTGTYAYSLNNGPLQSSSVFTGLAAGSYTVMVVDANNCSALTNAVVIANPDLLTVSAEGSYQVSCFNANDGVVTVTASGGTGDYVYSLNNGSLQSSNIFSGLAAGSYSVMVYDANNCTALTNTVVIINPDVLAATAEGSSQVSCYNSSNGTVIVSAVGGTGAYLYSLNGGTLQSSNIFTDLYAGIYSVVVYDGNNCSAQAIPVVIANPDSLEVSAGGSYQVSCHDALDGMIIVYAHGGIDPYSYSLNGALAQTSNVFTGLAADAYTVLVTDAFGCSALTPALVIYNPEVLTVALDTINPVSCFGAQDGSLSVVASGGTGVYQYSLNGNAPQTSGEFTNLPSGNYFVLVTDENNCQGLVEGIIVGSPEMVTMTASQNYLSCYGDPYNTLTISAMGGTPPYEYSIDGGLNWSSTEVFDSLHAGPVLIMVRDAHGCLSEEMPYEIEGQPQIKVSTEIVSQNVCGGIADGIVDIVVNGGIPPYYYSLDNGDPVTSGHFDNLTAGPHTIEVFDRGGCKSEDEFNITAQKPLKAGIESMNNADCMGEKNGAAQLWVTGGAEPYSYNWSNGVLGASLDNVGAGDYTCIIRDANECQLKYAIQIPPGTDYDSIKMHNVFSPNGDGVNDTWVVDNILLYPDNELVIINRWGNEVYTMKRYQNDWDGSQLVEGTYFYLLDVNVCGRQEVYKGYITILH